jgi:REP element-mobilizing transposase RayT
MPELHPIYTAANVVFAYQLRWAMTLFIEGERPPMETLSPIWEALEADGIRVLAARYAEPDMLQMWLSTRPEVSPRRIAERVKGRLWYAWRSSNDVVIQQHHALRSYGTQERAVIESYIAGQAMHHPMATDRATEMFQELSFVDEQVQLEKPIRIEKSLLWFNMHIVLVHAERWKNVHESSVLQTQRMIRRVCHKYGWRLSRCCIVADHLHLSLGANASNSAEDVVLRLMNNLAYVYGMKPVYQFSAYVATFGEYDQRALRRGE